MSNSCYAGQFLQPRSREEPAIDDGREIALGEVRKVLRQGPTAPGSLAKRARDDVDDVAIRRMLLTTEQRLSGGTTALDAIKKLHGRGPSGHGLLLPQMTKGVRLPSQSSNGQDIEADPRRAGATAGVADVDPQSGGTRAPARLSGTRRHSASVRSRSAGPEDDDVSGPLKARPDRQSDLDRIKEGPLDTVKWIKRLHKDPPKVGW